MAYAFSRTILAPITASTNDYNIGGSGSAVSLTYAAAADTAHVIGGVQWSYSAAPTSGSLTIQSPSGSTVFAVDVTAAGPGFMPFWPPVQGKTNTAMIVTLSSGSTGVIGKINATHWTE
mgnify:CR=1 FL=1